MARLNYRESFEQMYEGVNQNELDRLAAERRLKKLFDLVKGTFSDMKQTQKVLLRTLDSKNLGLRFLGRTVDLPNGDYIELAREKREGIDIRRHGLRVLIGVEGEVKVGQPFHQQFMIEQSDDEKRMFVLYTDSTIHEWKAIQLEHDHQNTVRYLESIFVAATMQMMQLHKPIRSRRAGEGVSGG